MRRIALLVAAAVGALPGAALADSCWTHNGSLMRLKADGAERRFVYEAPRKGVEAAGGRRGVLLFEGRKSGSAYQGTARVFNERACPGAPGVFAVGGPATDQEIVLRRRRDVFENCEPTGATTEETLIFTYAQQC